MFRKLVALAAFSMLSQAHAAHYGMAGCGLGSLVFQDQPGKIQIVAATLNDIVSPQTSAITSGTSGCYDDGSTAQLDYIENNMVALKEDAARGQGETLDGLVTMLGCEPTAKTQFKSQYEEIFKSTEPQHVLKAIKSNVVVQKNCQSIG